MSQLSKENPDCMWDWIHAMLESARRELKNGDKEKAEIHFNSVVKMLDTQERLWNTQKKGYDELRGRHLHVVQLNVDTRKENMHLHQHIQDLKTIPKYVDM